MLQIVLLAAAYVVAGELSFAILQEHAIISISVFAPEGFALAAVLLFGYRLWPGIFLGQLILAQINGLDVVSSLGIAGLNSLEAILAVWLFKHFSLSTKLERPRDFIGLFAIITLILQPLTALLGSAILLMSSVTVWADFWQNVFSWWFGNIMGQLLFTPMLLLLYHHWKRIKMGHLLVSSLVVFIANYGLLVFIPTDSLAIVLSITMPLFTLLILYKDLLYAITAVVMLALSSLYATHEGIGFFTHKNMLDNIVELNFFILAHFLTVVIIGSLVSERNRLREHACVSKHEKIIGTLIGGVAHHLNNDLMVILGSLSLALNQDKEDKTSVKELLTIAKGQSQKSAQLIDQLLVFVQGDSTRQERLHFNEYLDSTLNILIETRGYKDVFFDIYITEVPLYVMASASRMYQVLLQILDNAYDALKQGSKPQIRIVLEQQDSELCLRIEDNGCGISQSNLDYILGPFFTTKDVGAGTGLGLSVVKGIVQSHAGRIEVTSEDGQGTAVSIYLPIVSSDS